ncbi:MAG: hypothetical protein GX768_04345, partial [Chloroflexi bacterium]|nr:hypothetical protein [Chloroflexota bacterium]
MFPQLDPAEATYLARLIVSILGILFLLGLVFWMIRRKQKTPNTESLSAIISEGSDSDNSTVAHSEISNRSFVLEQTYRAWKAERLLQSEDGRSLFLRAGVEKSGLRYQLVASSQVQALAILLITLMAEVDPKASSQAEALFASLLAHPAYGQSDLSSWQYLPDLPRSPKLDPDPHAEAWLIIALRNANKHWPAMNRFHYSEIIPGRMHALHDYVEMLDPQVVRQLPFSGYIVKQLQSMEPQLEWSAFQENKDLVYSLFEERDPIEGEQDVGKLGFSLLQLGLLAWLDQDPDALRAIRNAETSLRQLVEDYTG